VHHEGIAEVVASVEGIPVLGNGDVKSAAGALEMMERTGCAGVMIGRGAFSTPWLFRDAWALQTQGCAPAEPTEREKIETVRRYFERMIEFRGVGYAMTHVRRRISWFAKRLGPCKPLKEAVRTARTPGDVHAALDAFLAGGLRVFDRRGAAVA
jgi:tRNA-dihydrouridine synthase